jgi:hypothetical protein
MQPLPRNIKKIQLIENIINETDNDNPDLYIETFNLPDGRSIHVVQDSVLITGTKQRVAVKFVKKMIGKNSEIKILQYAGVWNGFGPLATAYAANKLKLRSEVFLSAVPTGSNLKTPLQKIEDSRQINTLHALGAEIHLYPTYKQARNEEYEKSTVVIGKNEWSIKPEYMIMPMGLNDSEGIMIKMLGAALKKAATDSIVKSHKTTRIWLVCGTGGIMRAINTAFPKALLFILFTGGGKYKDAASEWAISKKNITILDSLPESELKQYSEERKKYYKSVAGYDDQIWPYIKKFAQDGDIIWNVASD